VPSEPAEIVMATRSTKPGRPSLEALALILMSGVLFAGSPASVHLRLLNLAYHSEAWERHAEGFSQVLATYGAGLLVLAIVSYACSMRGVTLMSLALGTQSVLFRCCGKKWFRRSAIVSPPELTAVRFFSLW
jgi:hypothetical protein